MIRIDGDKVALYQWDLNQRLILTSIGAITAGVEVHYSSIYDSMEESCSVALSYFENGNIYADIPNKMLQTSGIISAYLYVQEENKAWTEHRAEILVIARNKPANYVYTETEVFSYKKLEQRFEETTNGLNEQIKGLISREPSDAENGQLIMVKAVDKTGKPTKWEAIDRTHYARATYQDILPETTESVVNIYVDRILLPYFVGLGEARYLVTWNGVEYECVGRRFTNKDGVVQGTILELVKNSPFSIWAYYSEQTMLGPSYYVDIKVNDGSTEVTFSIKVIGEVVKPLDEKYIPSSIARTSDVWKILREDEAQLEALIEVDMLPAVYDANGAILTDENGKIILRY